MRRACPPVPLPLGAVLACAVLQLAASHATAPLTTAANTINSTARNTTNNNGICSSLDIRNNVEQFSKLVGCRTIEGQLSIVLMERTSYKIFENMVFPDLYEVTGYVLIYRAKGIKNLGDMFPNLTVVRGMELFKDFALVVFDNANLEAIGLRSLTAVQKGGVRIERNDRLCYVNTIDWSLISTDSSENIIRANYDPRFCGLCPNARGRTEDSRQSLCPTSEPDKRVLCWDESNCQRVCAPACKSHGCLENGTCCHSACLGGCDGITAHDCRVCQNFSFEYGKNRVCVSSCPNGTYELFSRCVTEEVCRKMPPPQPTNAGRFASRLNFYKITDNKRCEYMCPPGYMEQGTNSSNALCVPCKDEDGCVRECDAGKVIDSIGVAQQYTGCTHVKGRLEISIRAGGGNTLVELEKSLGMIRQITGSLQVTRSYPLVSLMFLKSLKTIVADNTKSDHKGQMLHILNNPNLELLWDWKTHGPLNISGGTIYIHLNPKLCYNQLTPLKGMTSNPRSNFTDIEVSAESNGNQAACLPRSLELIVTELRDTAAILSWSPYCPDDIRRLLGYSLYHMATDTNITHYEQRDACSDSWNVLDIPISENPRNTSDTQVSKTNNIIKASDRCDTQPMFSPLPSLIPYTRYAAYVKTYTTLQDKNGAQSAIIYFTTLPGRPSPPLNLGVDQLTDHSAHIRWSPPAMPNGTIIAYHVEVQANSYNRDQILAGRHSTRESCSNPTALASLIASRIGDGDVQETEEEQVTGDVNNGSCACKEEQKPTVRFSVRAEEERMDSIHFENDLQNWVYKKNSERSKARATPKSKRSVEKTLNKMLVTLTTNTNPKPGMTYDTTLINDVYIKSRHYALDGKTLFVSAEPLLHFTWYTVSVWACRAQAQNESIENYEDLWCSDRQFYTFLTLDKPNADTVSNVRAHLSNPNKTSEVNVRWDPPDNPNGFVVAYSVTYTKMQEDNAATPYQDCVPADEYEPKLGHRRRGLNPGNYSIRVTAITVRGQGNLSNEVFVDIPASKLPASYDWVWGVVSGCLVMLLVLAGVVWYVKRGLLSPSEAHKLFASVNPEYVSTVYAEDEWEVPRANIEFIRELGQGSFGMVYEGIAKDIAKGKPETRCAVKTVNEHATDRERIEFLNEASVMKAFDTFHVVRLMGVVSRGQPTLVVMELMERGDLKTYLRSHRPDADSSLPKKEARNTPTLQNILQMAIEIADGMAYLSAKKFVHRDLAARNCMVAGDLTVKVGDFGMTRDIYETDYYRKGGRGLLPVRWMSPESLKDGVFSSNSDVWSYGVVLWEMATLAMQPYQGLSNEQVVRYVEEGGVMERPEHCPDRLYELMRACWAHRPALRPSFLQLVADLAPSAQPYFRHRSFFHSPLGKEMYSMQRTAIEEDVEVPEVNVGAVATGSGSNLFGVSGRLASWVRELSSLRSHASDDAAAEPLQPLAKHPQPLKGPNGVLRDPTPP